LEIEMLARTFPEARCDESRQQQEQPAAREIMSTCCRRGKHGRLLRSTLEMRGNLDGAEVKVRRAGNIPGAANRKVNTVGSFTRIEAVPLPLCTSQSRTPIRRTRPSGLHRERGAAGFDGGARRATRASDHLRVRAKPVRRASAGASSPPTTRRK
jgi:hypothetical protein